MEIKHYVRIAVNEASRVAESRRYAVNLAQNLGFDETVTGKIALIVTEAANNLIKHTAQGGELLINALEHGTMKGLEVFTLDKGPGIDSLETALEDGYSTAGTPGTGLGAIKRLSGEFDIFSTQDGGTALVSRVWLNPTEDLNTLTSGGLCIPLKGETVSGDSWAVIARSGRNFIMMVDGLGHGPDAHFAAQEAVQIFRDKIDRGPIGIVEAIHTGLRGTRGAAVAVAEIDFEQHTVSFVGVGNIVCVIANNVQSLRAVSLGGTAGYEKPPFQAFSYPWLGTLVMHSDGCQTRWSFDQYPALLTRHPSLIAGIIYRDFNRGRDDASVVVVKERS
jgi:anti-sigma regulatory factor (Ser/Thr protein kinase)